MSDLIKIEAREIAGASVQTVNARELWTFVESKQDFSTWIKARIDKFGFTEGDDYLVHKFVDNPAGGRPTLDYHLTVDMGKELAMVENNDKGREVRRYFIECEKRAKDAHQPAFSIPQSYTEALRLAADLADGKAKAELEVAQQQKLLELAAPKVAMVDRIGASEGTRCLTDAAKELKVPRHALITFLEKNRWIYKRPLNDTWLAYDDKRHQSLLEHAYVPITKTNGETYDKPQVRITMKGLMKLAQLLNQTSNDDHAKGAA